MNKKIRKKEYLKEKIAKPSKTKIEKSIPFIKQHKTHQQTIGMEITITINILSHTTSTIGVFIGNVKENLMMILLFLRS